MSAENQFVRQNIPVSDENDTNNHKHSLPNGIWNAIRGFFLPRPTKHFFLRLIVVAGIAFVLFKYILLPCVISGASMEPTVPSHGFTFCWRGKYLFGQPQRGDIVIIKYGNNVFFLKRIVGLPGETVAFHEGQLLIDGKPVSEPYVKFPSTWNMPPTQVTPGEYYVVGDNRSMPWSQHKQGKVRSQRILGSPLF